MTSLKIEKGRLSHTVNIPGSKSYANRALILAAIKRTPFKIENLPDSTDVTYLLEALKRMGLNIEVTGTTCTILNSYPACESQDLTLPVGEGGTTARFLASLCLLGNKTYILILGERLKERPWQEFIAFVQTHGGVARLEGNQLILKGPLSLPDKLSVDCSRTTQFASGIALVFSNTQVIPANMSSSQSYWNMTLDLMDTVKTQNSFSVPLDWSSASYPLAFGALHHEIEFPGLKFDGHQADAKFLEVLKSFNIVSENDFGLKISPLTSYHSVQMDVSDCLDLVPALSFFLSHVEGSHELKGIENLKHKESDRLNEVIKLLYAFDKKARTDGHSLFIPGDLSLKKDPVDLHLPDDHRMVMTAALFLLHHGGGSLDQVSAVNKSYPQFFEILHTTQRSSL